MKRIYEGPTGTAKRARAALKRHFPGTKFYVRSSRYSGGSSVDIRWVDGPMEKDVEPKVKCFATADFDGMQDLKTYHPMLCVDEAGEMVQITGADFVFCQRERSPELIAKLEAEIRATWAKAEEILGTQDRGHGADYFRIMQDTEEAMVQGKKVGA